MGKGYLLDSNIIIYHLAGLLTTPGQKLVDEVLHEKANLSIISKIELLSWQRLTESHLTPINSFIQNSNVIHLDEGVVHETIRLRRNKKIKLPDAILAGTCIAKNYILQTRNAEILRTSKVSPSLIRLIINAIH